MGKKITTSNKQSLAAQDFPFVCSFSIDPTIEHWQRVAQSKNKIRSKWARELLAEVNKHPELTAPIRDLSIIDKHKGLLEALFSEVLAQSQNQHLISAITPSFNMNPVFATDRYKRLISQNSELSELHSSMGIMQFERIMHAYLFILGSLYDVKLNLESPFIFEIPNQDTGLEQFFKTNINAQNVRVKVHGELPNLSAEDLKLLRENYRDLDTWYRLLPPDLFEFSGYIIFSLFNVTIQEILSRLKYSLLDKGSVTSQEKLKAIEFDLQSLFKVPGLRLGLAAFNKDKATIFNHTKTLRHSFVLHQFSEVKCAEYCGSIYEKLMVDGEIVVVEDIAALPHHTGLEQALIEQNIKSIILAPLMIGDEPIGIIELGAPNAGELTALDIENLKAIVPLFSVAIERSTEELENEVQAIIKEKCTAIHPAVEWRFQQAAQNLHAMKEHDTQAEMEEILFDQVFPLFGQCDIRNSSTLRNRAIQIDLTNQIKNAIKVLDKAIELEHFPVYDDLRFRLEQAANSIKQQLVSSDETKVSEFFHREIHPLFEHLKSNGQELAQPVNRYMETLNQELGSVTIERAKYEQSLNKINEQIGQFLEQEQRKAQHMYPHYFEKYKTDGIEYNMYIGASIHPTGIFHDVYLKNLRLWQLLIMCEVTRIVENLAPTLAIPMHSTQLILVHSNPVAIRFRQDEKQFDVDGSYNLRYEIIKKRIDKALILGTKERLTQPGKLAIIYSHADELREYRSYIEFLRHKNQITGDIEMLELDPMQGVQGLKAIRLTINTQTGSEKIEEEISELLDSIK